MNKRIVKFLSMVLVFTILPNAHSLELNSKIKNTDKSIFNTNPGTQIQSGLGMFSGEYNYSSNPLVIRNTTTGKVTPLVDSVMSFDIGMNYGFSKNFQLGVLLPFEKASAKQAQQFLNGPYFEAKMKFSENFAFVPFYQVGSSSYMTIDSTGDKLLLGSPNGMYGGKLVTQFGNPLKDWGVATQIGYAVSPDNAFSNIDQSSRILAGVSLGAPLTEEFIGAIEINAEQYKNRLPLEVLGIINYRQESYNVQLGMGSGNLQASGSNPFKMFFGVTMFFGGKPSSGLIVTPKRDSKKKFDKYQNDNQQGNDGLYEEGQEDDAGNGPEVYEIEQSFIPTFTPNRLLASASRGIASDTVSLEDEIMNSIIDSTEQVKEEHHDPLADITGDNKIKTTKDIRKSLEVAEKKEVKPVSIKLVEPSIEKKIATPPKAIKNEIKKVAKNTKRMDKLPNGQKVKVFSNSIDEMPSEVGVVYLTEKEFQDRKKSMMKDIAQGKKEKVLEPKVLLGTIKTPNTVLLTDVVENQKVENFVESRPVDKKSILMVKEKDPIVMIPEHVDVVVQDQGNELSIVPVDVLALGKKKKTETTPIIVETKLSDEELVKSFETQESSQNNSDLTSVDTVTIDNADYPQVNISVLSREDLKNSLSKEFGSISLEETRQDLSRKVLEEQRKINAEMARIKEEEMINKKALEDAENALKIAEEDKRIREESPLTEGSTYGKASTDKELKSVDLTQRRHQRPIVVALPQARLNAFASGDPLPKLNRRGEVSNAKKQLLEEDYGIEEANGPAFGFGH